MNYLKIALRNLTRKRSFTLLNIAGLGVGVAVFISIFIIIQYHTSFDGFHVKKDRIFRVVSQSGSADVAATVHNKNVPFPLPEGIRTTFRQTEQVAAVYASHNDELQVVDENGASLKKFKESQGVFFIEPSFFEIFDFPLLSGSYSSLKDPNNVLVTKETAETYFGDWKAAMGKTIRLTGTYRIGAGLFQSPPINLKVTGVLATIPANTDFQFKLVVAYGTDFTGDEIYGFKNPDWSQTAPDFSCYVLLPGGGSPSNFNRQLKEYARITTPAEQDSYHLQPLEAIHYDTIAGSYSNKTIGRNLINVLWLIASFILLIACVNFINLSTAQAVNRAKEVGVRKVLGSNKSQLRLQFLAETFLIVAAAVMIASVIAMIALPSLNQLLELSLSFDVLNNTRILLWLFVLTIIVTVLAGFYPSIVLSRFSAVNAIKSKGIRHAEKGISLRRGLVVSQFVIAQVLIIGTLALTRQMNFFMNQPLGFDKEAIVNVPFRPDSTGGKLTSYLRQELSSINGVQEVSFSSNTPAEYSDDMWTKFKFDRAIRDAEFEALLKFADTAYIPAYKLQLVAGRNLQASDMTQEFLVNEEFVKRMGFVDPEDILNKEITMWDDRIKCSIVGVLKDFNDRSFHHEIAPLLITTNITMYRQAGIKLATTDIPATLAAVQKVWERKFPELVYEYKFLDEKIESFYKQESQLAQLYKIFAAIAVFLSCLGLYGLASFMAVQRIKEVGIRKVLGASVASIVYLFSKEFIILISIAFIIAAPIAWYYMHQYLQDYAYRVSVSWWLLALGGLIALGVALLTISFEALKAAVSNPVKNLRNE